MQLWVPLQLRQAVELDWNPGQRSQEIRPKDHDRCESRHVVRLPVVDLLEVHLEVRPDKLRELHGTRAGPLAARVCGH